MLPFRAILTAAIVATSVMSLPALANNAAQTWEPETIPADGGGRVALVIGNSAYRNQPLRNPANDATLMSQTLSALGFKVKQVTDADQKTMKRAIRDFGRDLRQGGDNTIGLFYFAGHGVQVRGENYLIPVGAQIEVEADVDIEGIEASDLLRQMEFAGNGLNIVILDACRNNPFARSFRSGTRGLAKMDAPAGSLVAYSTAPGQVALDGDDRNSPYTQALVDKMRSPGLPIEQLFKQVRIQVMSDSAQKQVPWESSSLTGNFFFAPKAVARPDPEEEFWKAISGSRIAADYEAYLRQFPNGRYAALARGRADHFKPAPPVVEPASPAPDPELVFWDSVKDSEVSADFEAYLAQYPQGQFAVLARSRAEQFRARQQASRATVAPDPELIFWDSIKDSDRASDYRAYVRKYPAGAFAALARSRARSLAEEKSADRQEVAAAAVRPSDIRRVTIEVTNTASSKLYRNPAEIDFEVDGSRIKMTMPLRDGWNHNGSLVIYGDVASDGRVALKGYTENTYNMSRGSGQGSILSPDGIDVNVVGKGRRVYRLKFYR